MGLFERGLRKKWRPGINLIAFNNLISSFLRENKRYTQIEIDKVLYLDASGNYTKVFLPDQTLTVREKISELFSEFETKDIIQVHKSFAVAKKHISSIIANQIMINEHQIPFGKMFKSNVDDLLR